MAESGGSSGGDGGSQPVSASGGGNRWPRQETEALIKIRTDMDVAFRDASLKGPLWDEVSRKLAELGYHRNSKKCKEKFENVFKYHKRTKDGRATKSEGKTYRFFDQLEALDTQPPPPHHPHSHQTPPQPPPHHQTQAATPATPLSIAMPMTNPLIAPIPFSNTTNSTVSSTQNLAQFQMPSTINPNPFTISFSAPIQTPIQDPASASSSSGFSSDEEPERGSGRKRKWEEFFERLTREVMEKQEEMQKKFLEALEKRELDRVARDEAWRAQELARVSKEREILAQERAVSAAKDAALFAFLQKVSVSDQNLTPTPASDQETLRTSAFTHQTPPQPQLPTPPPQPPAQAPPPPQPIPQSPVPAPAPVSVAPPPPPQQSQLHLRMLPSPQNPRNTNTTDNGGEKVNFSSNPSSSRWPKTEIEALIKLRTNLDLKYQENAPKGPLWEEISAGMLRLGYNRNAKRCKEKWENINKYYKKVKESNRKRPEDSKTCPYFSQLEAIYKERAKTEVNLKQENVGPPIMAQPEQQWPVQNRPEQHWPVLNRPELPLMEGHDSDNDDMDDDDDDEDDEAGNYEMVANKPSSMGKLE